MTNDISIKLYAEIIILSFDEKYFLCVYSKAVNYYISKTLPRNHLAKTSYSSNFDLDILNIVLSYLLLPSFDCDMFLISLIYI